MLYSINKQLQDIASIRNYEGSHKLTMATTAQETQIYLCG